MVDFRQLREAVKNTLEDIAEDPKWGWEVEVQKDKLLIYWEYLQYYYKEDSHFTIKAEGENLVAFDDWSRLMVRVKVGEDLEQALKRILQGVIKVAYHYY